MDTLIPVQLSGLRRLKGFWIRFVSVKVLCVLLASTAYAYSYDAKTPNENADFKKQNLYVGGGAGLHFPDHKALDNELGVQVFGGYHLEQIKTNLKPLNFAAEVGYSYTAEFDGVWVSGLADYALDQRTSGLVRIGIDFGDDDGLLFGFGADYGLSSRMAVRGEYVLRDDSDSLQVNFILGL